MNTVYNKSFRATSGLDAAGQNAINMANPRMGESLDGVNLGYFQAENSIQQYDPTRDEYNLDFIVEFNDRLYKNTTAITTAEEFNLLKWRSIRVDPEWIITSTSSYATSGDHLFLRNGNDITISLPLEPFEGDTVTIRDGRGDMSFFTANITATNGINIIWNDHKNRSMSGSEYLMNIPNSTVYFVYNGSDWTFQIDIQKNVVSIDSNHESQTTAKKETGGYKASIEEELYLFSSGEIIYATFPPKPNVGDRVLFYDANGQLKNSHFNVSIDPLFPSTENHYIFNPIFGDKVKNGQFNPSGYGGAIFSIDGDGDGVWRVFISDNEPRWYTISENVHQSEIRTNYTVKPASGVTSMEVILPKRPYDGDWIRVTNLDYAKYPLTLKVHPDFADTASSDYKILGSPNDFIDNKYSDYDQDRVLVKTEEFTIPDNDTGYDFLIRYTRKNWEFVTVSNRIDVADENHRKRPGLARIADVDEALVHDELYAHNEDANKSWAKGSPLKDHFISPETLDARRASETIVGLARIATTGNSEALEDTRTVSAVGEETSRQALDKTNYRHDLIITPLALASRIATETRGGVVELATQSEIRSITNHNQVVTPKRYHEMQAEEGLTGVAKLVVKSNNLNADGTLKNQTNMRVGRGGNGKDNTVFDKTDHLRMVTPKMLDEYRATQNQAGILWVTKDGETRINDSTVDDAIITPKSFARWTADTTVRGIVRRATNDETIATSGSGEGWDNVYIAPNDLNSRTATEIRRGLVEMATQSELDAGTSNEYRAFTPLRFKNWNKYDHFITAGTDGLTHTGNIWDKVTFTIASANETQRGTLQVATQSESNANNSGGGLDNVMLTPKKLNARRATTTLAGIAELATDAEVDLGVSTNTIITPSDVLRWTRTSTLSRMTETRMGVGETAPSTSNADGAWIKASVSKSTTGDWFDSRTDAITYGTHNNNPYVVSPRGLNYALRNYVPIGETVRDSHRLGNVVFSSWARRDIDQDITGKYTFTKNDVEIQGASPRITYTETDQSNYQWVSRIENKDFIISQNGTSKSRFVMLDNGETQLHAGNGNGVVRINYGSVNTDNYKLHVDGAVYEEMASANNDSVYSGYTSPASGRLREKYLGINNVSKATVKLVTARTFLSHANSDLTGSFSFDGTANPQMNFVIKDNSHNHAGENITSGTIPNARILKSNLNRQGLVKVTNDARTEDPTDPNDDHLALSAGVGKEISERVDTFTPNKGTGDYIKYREYIQVGSVRMSASDKGVMEFTFDSAI